MALPCLLVEDPHSFGICLVPPLRLSLHFVLWLSSGQKFLQVPLHNLFFLINYSNKNNLHGPEFGIGFVDGHLIYIMNITNT